MAQKRMYDKSIIDTERFYSLPFESQLIYFHLCLHADVKGFVEPKKIARLVGLKIESISPLIMNGYVILFKSGVVVITNWNQHNKIRESREAPTRFTNELNSISLQDNGLYQLLDNSRSTPAQSSVVESSVVESSVVKGSIVAPKKFKKPSTEDIKNYCLERNNKVDSEKFYDYYESNGWKVGKNTMKDWRAAVRTWERNSFEKPSSGVKKFANEDLSAYKHLF